MTSRERVLAVCAFRQPDRIPRFDTFLDYPESWRRRFGDTAGLTDIAIWYPDETVFPSRARRLETKEGWIYEIDPWGRTVRRRTDAHFVEILEVPIPEGRDPEKVQFEPPAADQRYLMGESDLAATAAKLAAAKAQHCIFGKTGGPYLRTSFVRGENQFLMDMASDTALARALVDKMAEHLVAVGVEEIRRWSLQDTGIWIYDDMACNRGPMFSPELFAKILLPAYRRMIRAYKDAGARYVFLHSDGDIRLLLDMLLDAGIDGIHPLERRANMNICELRKRFPPLILAGGMDNTDTLIHGPASRIETETREIIELGRHGGVIIGTHSISPEVPLKHFMAYDRMCRTCGVFVHTQKHYETSKHEECT